MSQPLHVAAAAGSEEICSRLLEKGADADARDVVRVSLCLPSDSFLLARVRTAINFPEGSIEWLLLTAVKGHR